MKTIDKALIYEAERADARRDRIVRERPSGRLTVVPIGASSEVIGVARELASQGVRLIELCGGISPSWRPRVETVVGDGVRVSSVAFGIESLPAAAAYNEAYLKGVPPRAAFIILQPGANAVRDRFVQAFPPLETTFVPVPDEATGADVAAELVAAGYGLIELYGGFTSAGAGRIIEVVDGCAPVGIGGFTLDQLERYAPRAEALSRV
ncbi:MAG: DUF6506 family protein [Proteobacteria bacterium]|nr:DUF6506 family protein [Pseudomonadota bacterium]